MFFFQAEDGIRDLVRSRGLGDVYKRQAFEAQVAPQSLAFLAGRHLTYFRPGYYMRHLVPTGTGLKACLLYTSDAADERSSVDLGGRRIIKQKKK